MTSLKILFATLALSLAFSSAYARDTQMMWDYSYAMASPESKAKLTDDIKIEFGAKKHTNIKTDMGEVSTNKKTNGFNKSDEAACMRAFLSAMISLQGEARKRGGNAVINVRSNYKNHLIDSDKQFECGAGAIMAGVAFKGKIVTLTK